MALLTDADIFGTPNLLSDADIFGGGPTPPDAMTSAPTLAEIIGSTLSEPTMALPLAPVTEGPTLPDLAVPFGAGPLRPFMPSERRDNPDGSFSTEVTRTVEMPDGSWSVVPSLWMGDDGPQDFDAMDDDGIGHLASEYEARAGERFPRFGGLEEADAWAMQRSEGGGATDVPLAREIDPMQTAISLSRRDPGPEMMTTPPTPFNPTADTAMGDLMAGYLGMKTIPGAMQVAGGAKQLQRAQDITRAMELADELGFDLTPEDAAEAVDRQTALIEQGSGSIADAIPGIMDLNRQAGEIPLNPAAGEAMQADTWGESVSAALEDPAGVARTFALRSLAPSAPTALAAILGSVGGPFGATAAAGGVGGGTDYAMTIAQEIAPLIAEMGVDPNDTRAVYDFMRSNPDALAGMIESAAQRGGIIGAFDAASGGVSGLLAKAATGGGVARHALAAGANTIADPVMGAAGEAAAQAAGGGGGPGDIMAEALGGLVTGAPVELAQAAVEGMKQPAKAKEPPAPEEPYDAPLVTGQDGQPVRVYHGSTEQFDRFDPARRGSNTGAFDADGGFFFTSNPKVAETYAKGYDDYDEGITGPLNRATGGAYGRANDRLLKPLGVQGQRADGDVREVNLAMNDPLTIMAGGAAYDEGQMEDWIARAKREGKDGLIVRGTYDAADDSNEIGDVYVAFDPRQIVDARSATESPADGVSAPAATGIPPEAAPAVADEPVRTMEVPAPDPATPETPEPPTSPRKPFTQTMRRSGLYVAAGSPAARQLALSGITPKTHVGLFHRNGVMTLDNISADEYPEIADLIGRDGHYLDPEAIIAAIHDQPLSVDQQEVAGARREWERGQSGREAAPAPATHPRGPDFSHPEQDIDAGPVRSENIRKAVIRAENDGAPLTREERARIIDRLDKNGGSVEYAIEHELTWSVLNAEAGEPVAEPERQPIPGWDAPGGDAAARRGGAGEPAGDGLLPDGSEEGAGQDRLARPGAADVDGQRPGHREDAEGADREPTEGGRGGEDPAGDRAGTRSGTEEGGAIDLTPEGRQQVIPGAERIADRERAQRAQEAPKRGGNAPMDDDGLFGDPANRVDLFDQPRQDDDVPPGTPTVPRQSTDAGGATPRSKAPASSSSGKVKDAAPSRPGGRLSPKFLDFSFTDRPSVYGAAFRAAGMDPGKAQSLPMERQISILRGVIKDRFGIEIEMPKTKVAKKNLVGRKVTVEKQSITTVEAVDQMLDAYRNLQMMAHILNVPAKALALAWQNKPITLSLISRRRMPAALGMFSWGKDGSRVISLPGRSNSFAHEWAHALDHFLGLISRNEELGMLSRKMDTQGVQSLAPKAAVVEAFGKVMNALYGDRAQLAALQLDLERKVSMEGEDGEPTPEAREAMKILADLREGKRPPAAYLNRYFETSEQFDTVFNGGAGYFQDPAEMFARAFESWVGITASAISDLPLNFMSKGDWAYNNEHDQRLAMTFPKGADALGFSTALVELSHAMARMQIFGKDKVPTAPEDVDIYTPGTGLMRLPPEGLLAHERREINESIRAAKNTGKAIASTMGHTGGLASGIWYSYLTSLTSAVHSIANRHEKAGNPKAATAIRNIADMIGNDPGAGRLVQHVYQQEVETQAKRNLRRIDHAVIAYTNHRQMSEAETKTLHALLTGQNVPASSEMKEFANSLRTILKSIWYDLKGAGITLGYADSYLPRIVNKEEVQIDTAGFRRDAAKVYEGMFEKEVVQNPDPETQAKDMNTVIRGLRARTEATTDGERQSASVLTTADEDLIAEWRKAEGKVRAAVRKGNDPSPAAVNEAQRLRSAVLRMLKKHFGEKSARDWHTRIEVGDSNDFDTMGPTGSFLKGRVLPQEADAILHRWIQNDPIELIAGYAFSAARRAQWAKMFGPSGEKLENMIEAAVDAGANGHEVGLIRSAVNSAAGRFKHPNRAGEGAASGIFFVGTISLLGRATFASLAEPTVAGLRTGAPRDSARAMVGFFRTMVSKGRRADLMEMAHVIGLTTSAMRETVMANRMGADSAALSKGISTTLAKFMHRSMLAPLTNLQNASQIPLASTVILRHLRAWEKSGQAFADKELNELGIAQEDRADLLKWLSSLPSIPGPADLIDQNGDFYNEAAGLWARATVRLINTIVQNPLKSDRPIMANHPVMAAMYGIMSFTMAFHRNILVRNVRRIAKAEGMTQKGVLMANAAAGVGVLFAGQFLATVIREALFNQDKWEELDDDDKLLEWLLVRAFGRTGLTGMFDPLVNLATGIRYDRDLTTATAGPYLGSILQNVQTMMELGGGRNSPNTNTAEWNAARALYQLAITPLLMASATVLPAGPISGWPAASAIWFGGSPQFAKKFADFMAGERMQDGETYKSRGVKPLAWEFGD